MCVCVCHICLSVYVAGTKYRTIGVKDRIDAVKVECKSGKEKRQEG